MRATRFANAADETEWPTVTPFLASSERNCASLARLSRPNRQLVSNAFSPALRSLRDPRSNKSRVIAGHRSYESHYGGRATSRPGPYCRHHGSVEFVVAV